jgi:multiple sugar transport system ATP-binding protein
MGRAIVRNPQVFLMDEPLSNLDAKLRVQTRTQIAKLQRDLGVTTVYVTHDQTEAMTMGDRIAVLKDGLLMQVGTPQELYDTPNNVFVAGFIGSPAMNIITAPVIEGNIRLGTKSVPLPEPVAAALNTNGRTSVTIGMRPEDLRVTDSDTAWPVEVLIVEGLGADAYVYTEVQLPGGATQQVVVRTDGRQHPTRGSMLTIEAIPHHVHFFDPETGQRLQY